MAQRAIKHQRLDARVTLAQKRLIEQGARLLGFTVTSFVVWSAQEAANRAIRDAETLTLQDEARDAFVRLVLNPPEPNEAARAAARRYKEAGY